MVECIAQHGHDVSIVPRSYLPYLELFMKLSKPGIAMSTYDSIKHSIHKKIIPTTSIENGISYGINQQLPFSMFDLPDMLRDPNSL